MGRASEALSGRDSAAVDSCRTVRTAVGEGSGGVACFPVRQGRTADDRHAAAPLGNLHTPSGHIPCRSTGALASSSRRTPGSAAGPRNGPSDLRRRVPQSLAPHLVTPGIVRLIRGKVLVCAAAERGPHPVPLHSLVIHGDPRDGHDLRDEDVLGSVLHAPAKHGTGAQVTTPCLARSLSHRSLTSMHSMVASFWAQRASHWNQFISPKRR